MRVLFIVPYPAEGASNRFRVLQFVPYLSSVGIECRIRQFYSRALWRILYSPGRLLVKLALFKLCSINRFLDLVRALRYDVVFIHREAYPVGPAWFEKILALMGKPYVYDFDDAIFLPNVADSNRMFGRLKFPGKVAGIIRGSRITLAGNDYLAQYAARAGGRQIEVLPTAVDTGRFVPPKERGRHKDRVVIGWIGSPTTISFIEQFRGVMEKVLGACGPRACFRIVGGQLGGSLPEGITCVEWSLETEVEELQGFDIGIMPMPDNEWTRGKCAFKAIEYMAVGIPAVCSPVGMNLQVIEDGVNGFLPVDEHAWVETLCRLAEDSGLRARLGQAGRALAENKYSVGVQAPRLAGFIRQAAGARAEKSGQIRR